MKILITGSSGFIGFHLSRYLLANKRSIYGIDNLNTYYDTKLKLQRLEILKKYKKFKFYKLDINNIQNYIGLYHHPSPLSVIN